jgi:hypothetical protein
MDTMAPATGGRLLDAEVIVDVFDAHDVIGEIFCEASIGALRNGALHGHLAALDAHVDAGWIEVGVIGEVPDNVFPDALVVTPVTPWPDAGVIATDGHVPAFVGGVLRALIPIVRLAPGGGAELVTAIQAFAPRGKAVVPPRVPWIIVFVAGARIVHSGAAVPLVVGPIRAVSSRKPFPPRSLMERAPEWLVVATGVGIGPGPTPVFPATVGGGNIVACRPGAVVVRHGFPLWTSV